LNENCAENTASNSQVYLITLHHVISYLTLKTSTLERVLFLEFLTPIVLLNLRTSLSAVPNILNKLSTDLPHIKVIRFSGLCRMRLHVMFAVTLIILSKIVKTPEIRTLKITKHTKKFITNSVLLSIGNRNAKETKPLLPPIII